MKPGIPEVRTTIVGTRRWRLSELLAGLGESGRAVAAIALSLLGNT
jgi:hypothetical protein